MQNRFDKEKQQMEEQVDTAKRKIEAQASRVKWMKATRGVVAWACGECRRASVPCGADDDQGP
jgi:hypothetical protein